MALLVRRDPPAVPGAGRRELWRRGSPGRWLLGAGAATLAAWLMPPVAWPGWVTWVMTGCALPVFLALAVWSAGAEAARVAAAWRDRHRGGRP